MKEGTQVESRDLQECIKFLKDECDQVPHLAERLLVDTVNGLDVVDDHLRFKSSQGLFSRLMGKVDGSGRRREIIIQQTQQQTMRGLLVWVEELTHNSSITFEALRGTRTRLEKTRKGLVEVAQHSIRNRQIIDEHAERIFRIEQRLDGEIESRLQYLEIDNEIRRRCTAWQAGRLYTDYPAVIQSAFVVDDLVRDTQGCCISEEHREYLVDSIVAVMKSLDFEPNVPLSLDEWLRGAIVGSEEKREVARWLLCHRPDALLHCAIGQSAELALVVPWASDEKRKGRLFPYYKPAGLVRGLRREAEKALEN